MKLVESKFVAMFTSMHQRKSRSKNMLLLFGWTTKKIVGKGLCTAGAIASSCSLSDNLKQIAACMCGRVLRISNIGIKLGL